MPMDVAGHMKKSRTKNKANSIFLLLSMLLESITSKGNDVKHACMTVCKVQVKHAGRLPLKGTNGKPVATLVERRVK